MARVQHNLCGCLAVLICLVFTSAIVQAQEDEAFVQYRQKVMTANSANMCDWGYPQTQTALSEPYRSPCARHPAYEHVDP